MLAKACPFYYNTGMNRLPFEKRLRALNMLVEGSSMRSVSRTVGVSVNTVNRLLVAAGQACAEYHDQTVRDVAARHIECDDIWSFCYAKDSHLVTALAPPPEAGSVWTWTALDTDSRSIISWLLGDRGFDTAIEFMADLRSRVINRPQITTDGLWAYEEAVDRAFGRDVDFAQLVKEFSRADSDEGGLRSQQYVSGSRKIARSGNPNLDWASTSLVERHNLTMRMCIRRFSRKTNGFSKKFENHRHALALYFVWYNFCRPHMTLNERHGYDVTPAMEAGLTSYPHGLDWLVKLVEGKYPQPGPRGPYRRKGQ